MATSGLSGALPAGNVPFTDSNGILTSYGRNLLNALIQRTGGAPGTNVDAEISALTTSLAALNAATLKKAANLSDLALLATALTNLQLVKQTGWAAPTGAAGSRGAVNTAFVQVVSAGYTQAEVQNISDQVTTLSRSLGQLIIDLEAFKAIGP